LSQRNGDVEVVECAFFGIVRSQALAQAVGLHAHNRVGILVKGGRAMEDLDADGIFLDLAGFACKEVLT
jgi:cation transport ATPase